jgi:hypothetical protein
MRRRENKMRLGSRGLESISFKITMIPHPSYGLSRKSASKEHSEA